MSLHSSRPISALFLSEDALAIHEDLTNLPYLYDETVLDCVIARYKKDLIYTWAGPILIAVNPVKIIPNLYSSTKIKTTFTLLKNGSDHLEPHVFSVVGLAHSHLVSEIGLVNQAVLVSGESGAGKTESAKFLLTYLTQVGSVNDACCLEMPRDKNPEQIQKKILASNPILEAFGNASTLRNDNSSRFGKLIRLQYQGSQVEGAAIDTYLLEKSRVAHQLENERNFHIFYQLLAGIKNGYMSDLNLHTDSGFSIISGNSDESEDIKDLSRTLKAFHEIGISDEEQKQIFQVVAAVICLGDIRFEFNLETEAWVVSSTSVSRAALLKASSLLGLSLISLSEALTVRKIAVASQKETTVFYKGCEREDECQTRRDSLMQHLYFLLFTYLVKTINGKLRVNSTDYTAYMGILDIYGFEAFEENSLEQLCINYANERLQQEFTNRYIASEHRLLLEEGFMDFPFSYSDNRHCVSVLDSPISVFSILNEECQLRKALDEKATCTRVCNALQNTGIISPSPATHRPYGFIIRHYAGEVTYTSTGLLLKNKDEVPQDIVNVLKNSENTYLVNLNIEAKEGTTKQVKRGAKKKTTLSKFKTSLDSLMKILTQCDLHYVRCLKPNFSLIVGNPDKHFLLDQLKSNGILETVKISQAGYPVRMLYADFVKRYKFASGDFYNDKEITFVILTEVWGTDDSGSPPREKCRFGRSRVFLSESCLHKLEELREKQKHMAAVCIQKNTKRFLAQRTFKTTVRAVNIIQRAAIGWLCRLRFLKLKNSAITIQTMVRGFLQRKRFQHTVDCVKLLQKFCRGWLCRKKYSLLRIYHGTAASFDSSLSYVSNSLESFPFISHTDYSTSEAEESARTHCRLLETEESGIETDTESLSGEGHKAGRASRFKTRHDLTHLRMKGKLDDEECNKVGSNAFPRRFVSRFPPPLQSNVQATRSLSKQKDRSCDFDENPLERVTKPETMKLKQYKAGKLSDKLRTKSLDRFFTNLSMLHIPLFYRDGVLSLRYLVKGRIKFHTRSTCLPYSTSVPIHAKPRGLIDAVT